MRKQRKAAPKRSRFALAHNLDRIAALERENDQLRELMEIHRARLVTVAASAAMYLDQLLIASGVDTGGLDV